jgi:hypothetical protein
VPISQELHEQMLAYKSKMEDDFGRSVTWQEYFKYTARDAQGDVYFSLISAELRYGSQGVKFDGRTHIYGDIQGVKPGMPNRPELVGLTLQVNDTIHHFNALEDNPANAWSELYTPFTVPAKRGPAPAKKRSRKKSRA